MKTLIAIIILSALTSCIPGIEIVTHSPYGSASYQDGVETSPITLNLHIIAP